MLRIEKSVKGKVLLTLSGRMNAENISELENVLRAEAKRPRIVLDLKDLTLVDRDAVRFLSRCEADSIKLKNCPAYIREWIESERNAERAALSRATSRQLRFTCLEDAHE